MFLYPHIYIVINSMGISHLPSDLKTGVFPC